MWLVIVVIMLGVLSFAVLSNDSARPATNESGVEQNITDPELTNTAEEPIAYNFDILGDVQQLVNKEFTLPSDYAPNDLEVPDVTLEPGKAESELAVREVAARALEEVFKAAGADSVVLYFASGYRPYTLQQTYYNNAQSAYGPNQNLVAKPGTSEHQTGLAADISGVNRACRLEQCFKSDEAGIWLADNAHKYGFILRYPEDKQDITGYSFEPWHYRYLGIDLATKIHDSNLTFEEFVASKSE